MGIEPEEGISPLLAKGGFEAVREAVKRIGREGWSAGQVLEQVRVILCDVALSVGSRCDPSHPDNPCAAEIVGGDGYRRM